jgi:hypothetical protein
LNTDFGFIREINNALPQSNVKLKRGQHVNKPMRNNIIKLILLPIAIILWIVGWSMVWAASGKEQKGRLECDRATPDEGLIVVVPVIQEECEA